MKTELTYADITEELCRRCAFCCRVFVPVELDDRTSEYFMEVGLDVKRDSDNPDVGVLDAGMCRHLTKNGEVYKCGIYSTRPQLCKDYNCVAWAKVAGVGSEAVNFAITVYNRLNPAD